MTVTKVVGFDLSIPKHFSLNFYDFIRFYMEFTSLLFLKTKEKGNELLHLGPWISVSSHRGSLAGLGNRGGAGGRNPAWGLTGGVGEVGEKLHGVERNSGMGSVGARDGRSGGSAKSSGRRR